MLNLPIGVSFIPFVIQCNEPWPSEVFGRVVDIDSSAMTVTINSMWNVNSEMTVIQVTNQTMIQDNMGNQLSFDDIQLEDMLFSIGRYDGDMFVADEIFLERDPGPPEDILEGIITEIDGDQRIVYISDHNQPGWTDTYPVQITDETILTNTCGESIEFEDIRIEHWAFASGSWTSAGIFVADEFITEDENPGPGDFVEGVITEIDENAMMIYLGRSPDGTQSIAVQITSDTQIMGMFGPLTFSDLEIGWYSFGMGDWQGDVFVAAELFVEDENPGPGPGDFVEGVITEIDENAMMIYLGRSPDGTQSIAVQITSDTQIMGMFGPLTFSDLEIGWYSFGMGDWQGDVFVAAELFVEDENPGPGPGDFVEGVITEIDENAVMIYLGRSPDGTQSIAVQITSDTQIMGMFGPLTFSDLEIGWYSFGMGDWQGDVFVAAELFV